ncbi:MAG: hypothetical protein K0S25_1455 [Bacillus sp. (in: firmicutes)]|jgi:hypothetical protein|nr:hypothetical protein [Bacillus sp. (in: firmicutes)]
MKINNQKDIDQISNELSLLLFLLHTSDGEIKIDENRSVFSNINWNDFIQLTIHHRVFPIIYNRVRKINSEYIPKQVINALRFQYQKNVFRMLQLSGETEQLSRVFTDHNIKTLFLKGPVLATHLYGDISLRTSSDLDILIPIKDLGIAEEMLSTLGYIKDEYILSVLNDWKWRHHHFTFFHPQKKIKVEIHWRLNPGPGREPSFNELWERKAISSITTNQPIYILGNMDLFLFLVSHGARHGWSRLRWLEDIDMLLKKEMDWKKEKILLRRYNYSHLGGQALNLCSRLFFTKIPVEMKYLAERRRSNQLAKSALFYVRNIVNLHNEPLPDEVSLYHKKYLFLVMSLEQKILFLLSFLFPYPEDAQTLPLPKLLHFLYFPLRPFLWAWRRRRKQVLS